MPQCASMMPIAAYEFRDRVLSRQAAAHPTEGQTHNANNCATISFGALILIA
jgi:hypothetical protein